MLIEILLVISNKRKRDTQISNSTEEKKNSNPINKNKVFTVNNASNKEGIKGINLKEIGETIIASLNNTSNVNDLFKIFKECIEKFKNLSIFEVFD